MLALVALENMARALSVPPRELFVSGVNYSFLRPGNLIVARHCSRTSLEPSFGTWAHPTDSM
jgi:hypothetical protein